MLTRNMLCGRGLIADVIKDLFWRFRRNRELQPTSIDLDLSEIEKGK